MPTTCGYCSVGCGIEIGVKDGQRRRLPAARLASGESRQAVPQGSFRALHHRRRESRQVSAAAQERQAGARRVGTKRSTTMVERFRATQATYGPESLGVLSTGQLVTEEFYTLGKLVQLGFGTNNYDGNTTLCMATAVSGYKLSFGSDGPPGAYEDMERADVVLLIGANLADNHPILCQYLEANRNKTLIVADPRVSKTAMMADLHLPLKPRSDLALLNGIAHILIRYNLIDRAYIDEHTTGFAELETFLDALYAGARREITGLSQETDFQDGVAVRPRQSRLHRLDHGRESQHHRHRDRERDLQSGAADRTDRTRRRRAVFHHRAVQRDGHARSRLHLQHAGLSQVRQPGGSRGTRRRCWGIDESRLPAKRGLAYPDIVEAAVAKKIRALWIIATNPLVSYPESGCAAARAFESRFPGGAGRLSSNAHHRTGRPGAARRDLGRKGRHLHELRTPREQGEQGGGAAGRSALGFRYLSRGRGKARMPRGAVSRLDQTARTRSTNGGAFRRDVCATTPASATNCSPSRARCSGRSPKAQRRERTSRLYADGNFKRRMAARKLICADWAPFPEQPGGDYPFILNTGRTVEHWHTRTKTREVPILERLSPRAWLEMNPRDAKRLGLRSHDLGGRGLAPRPRARRRTAADRDHRARAGVHAFPFFETNVNEVTQSAFDPISREPNYKQCAVRVERSGAHS